MKLGPVQVVRDHFETFRAASVRAGGGEGLPRAGAEIRRCGASAELLALAPTSLGPCHARGNGFDLHAGVLIPGDRAFIVPIV